MSSLQRVFLVLLVISTSITMSCVTGSKSVKKSGSATAAQPEWFRSSHAMQADSVAYVQYATVLHSDSAKAVSIAEESAQHHLMIALDELNESIRTDLVNKDGLNALSSANFILQLRRFTDYQKDLKTASAVAMKTDTGYQGFAKVQITKTSFQSQMRTFLDRATTNTNRDAWMAKY